jgi:RNA ligase (TIGR02306 family)
MTETALDTTATRTESVETLRKLARIVRVASLEPAANADNLLRARVGGWSVLVKRDEGFVEGQLAVYFEPNAFLPEENPVFGWLMERSTRKMELDDGSFVSGHRLGQIRLRGTLSEGLLMSLEALGLDANEFPLGSDVTERLGILKYERLSTEALAKSDLAGDFPTHLARKTDSERAQNLVPVWEILRQLRWIATEKIDGQSMTVLRTVDGELIVCQRNHMVKPGGALWEAAERYGLDALLPGETVQMELYGPGIQANPLRIRGEKPVIGVFAFFRDRVPQQRSVWPDFALKHAVPIYEHLSGELPETVDEALDKIDRIKSLVNPERAAEGVVFHTADGSVLEELERRPNFKVISATYAIKHDS